MQLNKKIGLEKTKWWTNKISKTTKENLELKRSEKKGNEKNRLNTKKI